jgi:hypothetical protein
MPVRVVILLGVAAGLLRCGRSLPGQTDEQSSIDQQMGGVIADAPHLTLTPTRQPTAADSTRAAAIADTLRRAIAKYADVHAAEADGFRLFAPGIKNQPVFHYTRWRSAMRAALEFDPARPTSLLYRRAPDGSLSLIGAMYTAPQRATLEELDRRVPLSIARWHLHTNVCVPPLGERERWRETRDGKPVFGPASPIATQAACDAAGGRFLPKLFGWMVHVNVLENDPGAIWAMPHAHQHPS